MSINRLVMCFERWNEIQKLRKKSRVVDFRIRYRLQRKKLNPSIALLIPPEGLLNLQEEEKPVGRIASVREGNLSEALANLQKEENPSVSL